MNTFKIIPILGKKTDVPPDDQSLFRFVSQGLALTHDVGGTGFTLDRKRNACTKRFGHIVWSAAATDQATKTLGLFELYDGTNRNHLIWDNGRSYVYDSSKYPNEAVLNFDAGTDEFAVGETITEGVTGATAIVRAVTVTSGSWAGNDAAGTLHIYDLSTDTFTNDNAITSTGGAATINEPTRNLTAVTWGVNNTDLISAIRVGAYCVFTDYSRTHTPYKWKSGDDYISKLAASGTEYKFRFLESFQRRVFGLNSDQTDGNIEIRWSTSWPGTAITSLNFPATNQLYVPNDDPITGGATMGSDRLYVYCEDSIQQVFYYPDYDTPFRIITVVPQYGSTGHQSIINMGDRHYLFNKDLGFCEFRGNQFPVNGRPISINIENDIGDINYDYYQIITGIPIRNKNSVAWAVPVGGSTVPNRLFIYNYLTGQWTIDVITARVLDNWKLYSTLTWNDLITILGGTGATWDLAGNNSWANYISTQENIVFSASDGSVNLVESESDAGSAFEGYRVEPILHFGDPNRYDILNEIWFDICEYGNFSIDVYHRSGNTTGEVQGATWESLGSVSCANPTRPIVTGFSKPARLHQIKWGTDGANEKFQVNGITFKFTMDSNA